MKNTMSTEKLPAGTYWIGDPCYVITPWTQWLEDEYFDNVGELFFNYNDLTICAMDTEGGDGNYPTNGYGHVGVDAGMISAIPLEALKDKKISELENDGFVVKMKRDFTVGYHDGTIIFGNVEVYTGNLAYEDPYYDYQVAHKL